MLCRLAEAFIPAQRLPQPGGAFTAAPRLPVIRAATVDKDDVCVDEICLTAPSGGPGDSDGSAELPPGW